MSERADARMRSGLAVGLYVLAIAYAASWVVFAENGAVYLMFAVLFSFTATSWCIVDARLAGRRILMSLYWLIFFFWPIAVPIYLVWARRLRGLGLAALHGLGLAAAALLTYTIGAYSVAAFAGASARDRPSEAEAHFRTGAFCFQQGDFQAARNEFTAAIRLDPEMATAFCGRGAAGIRLGRHADALADFEEALRLDPHLAEAYVGRAAGYYQNGRYDATIADCSRAIELKPDMADAYFNRGNAFYQTRRYAQAIDDFTEALRVAPLFAQAYYARAAAHRAAGNAEQADADLAEAQRLGWREPR